MKIVITGAAGRIGRELVQDLSRDHELVLLDRNPAPDGSVRVANLSIPGRWMTDFRGADAVIHLAANPGPTAKLRSLLRPNVIATTLIAVTTAWYRIPRIVYASSGWVVYGAEETMAPGCYEADGPKIDEQTFRPRTAYGWSKAWGEVLGSLLAGTGLVSAFLAVRIGWFGAEAQGDERGLRIWLGRADLRSLFRRSVEEAYTGFHVSYGTSAQPSSPYDLGSTMRLLRWAPRELPPGVTA